MIKHASALLCLLAAACSSGSPQPESAATGADHAEPAHHGEGEHGEGSPPVVIRELEDGSRIYGREPSEGDTLPLSQIVAEPAQYEGQTVKTEGVITQVCQSMGCWMELAAGEGETAVRVPMAGHSFFLPRDIAGRRATVEGTVKLLELDAETRQHLEAEGAAAADQALSIEAVAVVVH